ncbi:MAG: FAD-dependent thymidylate synthase [Calditrichaeota bacterium]|nr:FAD-dependent thymidylate synthase [Calditrichota bacterium]RQW07800.1 MAG: FAD-dependent thymidylate synthase [Calditrichota bacterium]
MRVLLAGFNLDIETIKELKSFVERVAERLDGERFATLGSVEQQQLIQQLQKEALLLLNQDNLTPETLSAAYARISRNPKPINELRQIARQEVERARKSNQNIIFGLGHSSVAEHATFNFDILGVSRYAVETIEHFRLASYTEKSQRYILFKNDFVIPQEIKNTKWKKNYINLIKEQNAVYQKLYDVLNPYFFELYQESAKEKANHRRIEGLAKEDARYAISLATQTQLGMTVNARTLENMIAKCNCHRLHEIREYGNKLYDAIKNLAPSIVKYTSSTEYLEEKSQKICDFITETFNYDVFNKSDDKIDVILADADEDADDRVLAAVLFKYYGGDFKDAIRHIKKMSIAEQKQFYQIIYNSMNPWDSILREFEFVDFTFELIISASNYGQLKRHRMANISAQYYDITLGVTIPDSIINIGMKQLFMDIMEKTNSFYLRMREEHPTIAPYVLTNAHRRRILFKINLRELYHFSRLREDSHAQWDIRNTAKQMCDIIKSRFPLCAALLGGKDQFIHLYSKFLNN